MSRVWRGRNESCQINLICEHIKASCYHRLKHNTGHPKKLSAVHGHSLPYTVRPTVFASGILCFTDVYITHTQFHHQTLTWCFCCLFLIMGKFLQFLRTKWAIIPLHLALSSVTLDGCFVVFRTNHVDGSWHLNVALHTDFWHFYLHCPHFCHSLGKIIL